MPPDTPPADQRAVSDTTNPTAGIDWSTTAGRMEGRRRLWALADDLDAALARVRALEEALRDICIFAKAPHNTDLAESMRACGVDVCMGCLIEGTAEAALRPGHAP